VARSADGDALLQPQLLLELLTAKPEGPLAARRHVRVQMVDVPLERRDRFDRCIGEVPEDVVVVEPAEGARQIVVDEPQRAPQALEPDLDEDARRVLDVVAGRLHQARHLAQLGDNPARPLGERGVTEQHLTGQAGGEEIRIVLRVAFPRPDRLQLEEAGAEVRIENGAFQPLAVGQPRRVDGRQAAGEPSEIADLTVNRMTPQILEQIVMQVHAVERRARRLYLMEIREVFVNEVRKGFG